MNNTYKEFLDDLNEGFSDNIKRKFNKAFWWDGYSSPKDMIDTISHMSDEQLENLAGKGYDYTQGAGDGSPRAFQIKVIDKELRKRGLRDFKKFGNSRKMTK